MQKEERNGMTNVHYRTIHKRKGKKRMRRSGNRRKQGPRDLGPVLGEKAARTKNPSQCKNIIHRGGRTFLKKRRKRGGKVNQSVKLQKKKRNTPSWAVYQRKRIAAITHTSTTRSRSGSGRGGGKKTCHRGRERIKKRKKS